uniref:NADH-ubiquinone oxidoreductase chain 6 n=1 Tax=Palaeoagraecia brunnea TaxID=2981282 RepID=A0A977R5L3_9ORTH|nr:NADH dehydrogenase subunit 6 [Palaeoagraecia brunnea]UXL83028.1 NADH dehydrogenase subunit 6 [Palaeoagraecia brunnea]
MLNFNIMMMNLLNSLIFTQISHPLAMTLTIIIQTLLVCLITGLKTSSFWFSYVLFLVFLGGMLVLFIYITSLASNEMFITPVKMLTFVMTMMIFSLLLSFSLDYLYQLDYSSDMKSIEYSASYLYMESNYLLTKLYNNPTSSITLMLVIYLLLTLIVIVKITNIFAGPLRQKN